MEPRFLLSGYGLRAVADFDGVTGQRPDSALLLAGNGNLYGTTPGDGAIGAEIFEIAAGSRTLTRLAPLTDGPGPASSLISDASGDLFGSIDSTGAVYELPAGANAVNTLATVSGIGGSNPQGPLVIDSSGNLYGTAKIGGASNLGTIFEIASGSGSATALATFTGANGADPVGGLISDAQGDLFGTTSAGGADGDGTIFEYVTSTGVLRILADFDGVDGSEPAGRLLLDAAGDLFGTTSAGGSANDGTIFELAAGSGTITTLHAFGGSDGSNPEAGLIADAQGNLFGTTASGGSSGLGTVFELAISDNQLTTLASFDGSAGATPLGELTFDSQGDLFGTASAGGSQNWGTVYELIPGAQTLTTSLVAPTVLAPQQTATVTATFTDPNGFRLSAITSADLTVRQYDGTPLDVTGVAVRRVPGSGGGRFARQAIATFSIAAPDGTWTSSDSGLYTATLSSISDRLGQTFPSAATSLFVNLLPYGAGDTGTLSATLSANFSASRGTKTPAHAAAFVSVGNPATATIQGPVTATLYVSTGPTFNASTRLSSITRSLKLRSGRSQRLRIAVPNMPALGSGPYTLLVIVQAPDGTLTSNVGPSIAIQ